MLQYHWAVKGLGSVFCRWWHKRKMFSVRDCGSRDYPSVDMGVNTADKLFHILQDWGSALLKVCVLIGQLWQGVVGQEFYCAGGCSVIILTVCEHGICSTGIRLVDTMVRVWECLAGCLQVNSCYTSVIQWAKCHGMWKRKFIGGVQATVCFWISCLDCLWCKGCMKGNALGMVLTGCW